MEEIDSAADLSYDDAFNDSLFATTLNNSTLTRPKMWPSSVSEMRGHTSYATAPQLHHLDTGHSSFMMGRAASANNVGAWHFVPKLQTWVFVQGLPGGIPPGIRNM